MNQEKILIIGSNGQLGKALQQRFPHAMAVDKDSFDITDKSAMEQFTWKDFDTIINAAAYTNVDGAETSEGRVLAWEINAQAIANIVPSLQPQCTFIHISSDYVFDGSKEVHTELEPLSPLGVYGQTKAAGDLVACTHTNNYILRTTWVIGDGHNFVRTMIGLAAKNISPTVVADQIGRLTFAETLVDAIEHLLSTKAPYGIYNVTNDGETASWADMTRLIFKTLGREDLSVTNTTTAEYFSSKPTSAPRPLHSEMDLAKIKETGLVLRPWQEDLIQFINSDKKRREETN